MANGACRAAGFLPAACPSRPKPEPPLMSNTHAVRFHVLAEACPGLLPRLLQPLARRDLVPDAFQARREGELMRAEITLHAMPAEMVHLVAGNLGQVVGVLEVETRRPEAAIRRAA
ncbi:hypothetical protein [Siccirubricoccus sp. G192]|uniref:hypothetical protein n=1 Tax=Siccirubricoccus sp. G192 TaxID=2849651 RepID=UPI0020C2CFCC|nr:hypothetical protein [Siccirubricoccus sp. G192]